MIRKKNGYTLIELVMAVSLMIIVLTAGTAIFYRSFRSSGISDVQTVVNNDLRSLDEMIERTLRYGTVLRLVGYDGLDKTRDECLVGTINNDPVVGKSLVVRDVSGGEAVYSLSNGVVSSNSGVPISNPEIVVTKLEFTWYCNSGVNDKINLLIEATSSATKGGGTSGVFRKDINLLNSGIN